MNILQNKIQGNQEIQIVSKIKCFHKNQNPNPKAEQKVIEEFNLICY